jgi:hypothetical protein
MIIIMEIVITMAYATTGMDMSHDIYDMWTFGLHIVLWLHLAHMTTNAILKVMFWRSDIGTFLEIHIYLSSLNHNM